MFLAFFFSSSILKKIHIGYLLLLHSLHTKLKGISFFENTVRKMPQTKQIKIFKSLFQIRKMSKNCNLEWKLLRFDWNRTRGMQWLRGHPHPRGSSDLTHPLSSLHTEPVLRANTATLHSAPTLATKTSPLTDRLFLKRYSRIPRITLLGKKIEKK